MKIEMRCRGLEPDEALKRHAVWRVMTSLDRFTDELTKVVVQLSDVNGPKEGLDKQCQLTLCGPTLGSVTIRGLSGDVASAIDVACELASRSLARELERARDIRRTAGLPSGGSS